MAFRNRVPDARSTTSVKRFEAIPRGRSCASVIRPAAVRERADTTFNQVICLPYDRITTRERATAWTTVV